MLHGIGIQFIFSLETKCTVHTTKPDRPGTFTNMYNFKLLLYLILDLNTSIKSIQ